MREIGLVTIEARRNVEGKQQAARESVERGRLPCVSSYQGGEAVVTVETAGPS